MHWYEGEPKVVNRDVVSPDAGPNAPAAAVLQVGTRVLNEVLTADDGSKSFNSVATGDVVLNLADRSGDTGFDVDVVVGALNVPTGSVGTVTVDGVAAEHLPLMKPEEIPLVRVRQLTPLASQTQMVRQRTQSVSVSLRRLHRE